MARMNRNPTGPLGVAVIGAGYWGPNLMRNLAASAEFELRWVCDLDEDRARKALGPMSAVRLTTTLDDVLADPEVAAVAVATPAATHLGVAGAALAAGKHVLVEKPLASSYGEALSLVEEADRRGLTLMCDHTYCYTPAVGKIRELAREVDIVIIEHDMEVVFGLADDIIVLAQGAVLATGSPTEISSNERVREAYLGRQEDEDYLEEAVSA